MTAAAAAHGYSRAAFYLVSAAFEQAGMAGLLDERRGRRGPVKLTPEIVEFIRAGAPGLREPSSPSRSPTGSGCGCTGAPSNGSAAGDRPVVLAGGEAAQADYETLRAHLLEHGRLPDGLAAARFARRGAGRADRLADRRAGLRRRAARRRPPAVDPARRSAADALAAGFQFLLDAAATRAGVLARCTEVLR